MAVRTRVGRDNGRGFEAAVTINEDAPSNPPFSVPSVNAANNAVMGERGRVLIGVKPRFSDNEDMRLMLEEELI